MSQIANVHAIGVLIIDEIQHLSMSKSGGVEKMLNFFVTLVNVIGLPVVMIGLNIPSYERGVARVLGYDLPP